MNTKNKIRVLGALCALGYLLTFIIFYLPNYVLELPLAFNFTSVYLKDFVLSYLVPSLLCTALVVEYGVRGVRGALLKAIPLSLTYICFCVPNYYIELMSTGSYTTLDALLLVLIGSVLSLIVFYASITLLCLCCVSVCKRRAKIFEEECPDFAKKCDTGSLFSIREPMNAGTLASVCVLFIIAVGGELFDTVSYLVAYAGTYRIGEVIYICTRYVFHAAALLCSFVAAKYTRELLKEDE